MQCEEKPFDGVYTHLLSPVWPQSDHSNGALRPQVGHVKEYKNCPYCKAHSGIKWWSSEKLEPRIPSCVNLPIVVLGCQSGFPDPCQSKPTRIKADPHASELTYTRHRPTHKHQNLPRRVRTLSQSSTLNPLASENTHVRQIQCYLAIAST